MKVQERWHEKLHDWDQALQAYSTKLETQPDDLALVLGQMRCLEAVGEWWVVLWSWPHWFSLFVLWDSYTSSVVPGMILLFRYHLFIFQLMIIMALDKQLNITQDTNALFHIAFQGGAVQCGV